MSFWSEKRVLITGACGTVGKRLVARLKEENPASVCGIDNNETGLFFLSKECADLPHFRFLLCEVRDRRRLVQLTRGIDVILHTAALKHVTLCEQSPHDAMQTNVIGTQNVIEAAKEHSVSRVLFTSSDKAVNPTNVMGASKLLAERMMTAANAFDGAAGPIFASTRFGNVVGSRGSVVPLFRKQIANGGPVTLTDKEMTRFIMTLDEATNLVMKSVPLACGGEVFVTKMEAVRIIDLAKSMISLLCGQHGYSESEIRIETIGVSPGEKMYEELMNEEETRRTLELPEFYVILPAFESIYAGIEYEYPHILAREIKQPYNSRLQPAMTRKQVEDFLKENWLLESQIR